MNKSLVIIGCLISFNGMAQTIYPTVINYEGLSYTSTRAEIMETLGEPSKEYYPDYECGFLAGGGNGDQFNTLDYNSVKFTSDETSKYLIEYIDFNVDCEASFSINGCLLNCKTELFELVELFGNRVVEHMDGKDSGFFSIPFNEESDDGLLFYLESGILIKLEYQSPC